MSAPPPDALPPEPALQGGGLFFRLYQWMRRTARAPGAPRWLGIISFAEAVFFPIPPDVMLAPMTLVQPRAWWRLALLTTVTSVLGGLVGYLLGAWLIDLVLPWIEAAGQGDAYRAAVDWFNRYGFWAIFLAGFTPIPFKLFTIAAGSIGMGLAPFLAGALVGRGIRFGLVAGCVRLLGPVVETHLLRYIDRLGWATVAAVIVVLAIYGLRG